MQMQGLASDKTFHLKWNNHLQNLSQLFTTIYSSSALADVTLSCRDGTLKAHKLVLSACSPYFEQIFKDNPCQHPIVILKGIPFSEINLLVEFMYKGSVDVQEMDLQSLMHTASELEIRGLAYEARDNAAQLLNVNLEYPTYPTTPVPTASQQQSFPQARTDVERLKQIHMYQQSMMRAEEIRRRRRDEPGTHTVVNNILAAAAREMEEARGVGRPMTAVQTELGEQGIEGKRDSIDDDRPKKRVSILTPDDERLKKAKKAHMTVRFQDHHDLKTDEQRPNKSCSPGSSSDTTKNDAESRPQGIKVVQLSALQQKPINNDNDDSDEKGGKSQGMDDDEETDSSGSVSDTAVNDSREARPHVCEICELRFQRASHLTRHRLTHTGERPFTCGGCGRSFARSDKLRVHTKICERVRTRLDMDDPTVDMANESTSSIKRENSEVMSGMVRTTHRESGHLVFTPSGDVMLPPRAGNTPFILNSTLDAGRTDIQQTEVLVGNHTEHVSNRVVESDSTVGRPRSPLSKADLQLSCKPFILNLTLDAGRTDIQQADLLDQPRRGRGRPRKTPLPLTPKIKKRRGRPPKTSLDMEGCVLTSGAIMGTSPQQPQPQLTVTSHAAIHSQQNLLMKRKRGRPPKNYFVPTGADGRPNENYNASNLPFGDFSYLTDMINYPAIAFSYNPAVTSTDADRSTDADQSMNTETSHERTIDVSDSSSDEDDNSKVELEENVPPVACETQIMTVGDCQIVKLPTTEEKAEEKTEQTNETVSSSTPNSVTITPITTVGDCTIRPVENNT